MYLGKEVGRRQWLAHELESALVIICGELQSKHFIGGVEHVQNTFREMG